MPFIVKAKSSDVALIARREAAAVRVIDQFQLPDSKLLCFLDDEDWDFLKTEYGKANRGFHTPTNENVPLDPDWLYWPDYLQESITSQDSFGVLKYDFDSVIYLHGSTCKNETGLVMTLAHEVQHFLQYSNERKVWAENMLVVNLPRTLIVELGLKAWDVPIEREARIVSKRVAEDLFGRDLVRQYIDAKIDEAIDANDRLDWQFVRELPSSASFQLADETRQFFQRLKPQRSQLEKVLQSVKERPTFNKIDLEDLIGDARTKGAAELLC